MLLYRVFAHIAGSKPGEPGHPLYVYPRQGKGRWDNPAAYLTWYMSCRERRRDAGAADREAVAVRPDARRGAAAAAHRERQPTRLLNLIDPLAVPF